ncbi:type II toxin-antitoxin system YafQ family toxin [Mycoplasma mycoides]|uniref:type II toxin-antitoxin system YafQ family toxin n=1 Tax=Mycoplasma mycoides TaxID=2102 RepID=UPI00223FB9AE|nr:type II toxin-antitoxin system YafQ family toxin [Mycoplasma mycoides]QVK05365.1 type II toxin-antitoxin system YafQ family toxin [Mycoplasma mycoides subsp. capri]
MTKYKIVWTTKFKKDLKLAKKQNKDLNKLDYVINILTQGKELDAKYQDHSLTGIYKGYRECHIDPDWLLIYKKDDDKIVITMLRLGSHSNLFEKQKNY